MLPIALESYPVLAPCTAGRRFAPVHSQRRGWRRGGQSILQEGGKECTVAEEKPAGGGWWVLEGREMMSCVRPRKGTEICNLSDFSTVEELPLFARFSAFL